MPAIAFSGALALLASRVRELLLEPLEDHPALLPADRVARWWIPERVEIIDEGGVEAGEDLGRALPWHRGAAGCDAFSGTFPGAFSAAFSSWRSLLDAVPATAAA